MLAFITTDLVACGIVVTVPKRCKMNICLQTGLAPATWGMTQSSLSRRYKEFTRDYRRSCGQLKIDVSPLLHPQPLLESLQQSWCKPDLRAVEVTAGSHTITLRQLWCTALEVTADWAPVKAQSSVLWESLVCVLHHHSPSDVLEDTSAMGRVACGRWGSSG